MKCIIKHDAPGRLRVHALVSRMTLREADVLEYYLRNVKNVTDVKIHDRTCDAVIFYEPELQPAALPEKAGRAAYAGVREQIIRALSRFAFDSEKAQALAPDFSARATNRYYQEKLVMAVVKRVINRIMIPMPVRKVLAVVRAMRYIKEGAVCLLKRKIEVSVLDAVAIAVSLIRRDFKTAGSVMFLLNIGEILEEWTHKKSVDDLARTMALNVEKVWTIREGSEALVSIGEIGVGDEIIVRSGNIIPLDGKVISGEATVNQASITGESMPVPKESGSYVYAGTVVEEGTCRIQVEKSMGSGRYDRIISMIEESEKLKSEAEDKASHLADSLVPYSLGGTLITYLLTRNVSKALAILMVDFSCALKLSMPISVLSAMKEGSNMGLTIKGGKFLEAVAEADTIVFDKTGTLTYAQPKVAGVVAFGGNDENEMLRTAACLEEHYPHSMANAVVEEAKIRGLLHEENHSKVEYVVAHGISSMLDNEKVIIGSYHFVFQDEGCKVPEGEEDKFAELPDEYSHLYLAASGVLAAVILISDPLRSEAGDVVRLLHDEGISKVVMMTGDSERTAAAAAHQVGVDEYYSEVLPEDKANFIAGEHSLGRKVIMIGDGINDSPALSEADAGIAISDGAAIARQIADITVAADDLYALVSLRRLSSSLMRRIDRNYRFIIGFNFSLIVAGVAGIMTPQTTALLHNASTIGISLYDTTRLLPE